MLTGRKQLAKTSATPGKTQMINHFIIRSREQRKAAEWYLVDLPGYGYAKTSQKSRRKWHKMIEDYLRKRTNLVNTFVLIDGRHEPMPIDIDFINQLGEWQLPFALVFTKCDKMKPGGLERNAQLLQNALLQQWETLPPVFRTSATTGLGKDPLLVFVDNARRIWASDAHSL